MSDEALLYLRKSKGRMGIRRQRVITTAHLDREGTAVRGEYEDTDSTAFALPGAPPPPRKNFERLLADLPRYPGIKIAAVHADRILRNPEETERLIRACITGGHLIETASGSYDVSHANGRKNLRADANAAAYEVDHNRERILALKAEMAAEGRWGGGKRPFGFTPDPEAPGGLVHNQREARLLAAAAAALLDGTATLYGVSREWHEAGVTGSRGGHLSPGNVRKLLIAPRAAGLMPDGRTPALWPAVIPEDRWRLLAALLGDESRRRGPGPRRSHLLTGIALCGECGSPVIAAPGSRGPRYRCSAAARMLPGRKDGRHVTADLAGADDFAAALAVTRLKRDDAALLLRADHSGDRAQLLGEDAAQQALHDEQWHLYRAKAISARELAQGRAEIDRERAEIRSRLAALDEADVLATALDDPEAAWDGGPLDWRRSVVGALMYLTVFHARRGRPAQWRPGEPYFDADAVDVRWVRRLPSDG